MIDKLTAEQEAALPAFVEWWTAAGLCTDPADRPAAEAGVAHAYRAVGLEPPAVVVWLDSPMQGAVAAAAMLAQVGVQVGAQVGAQVRAQVWDQVGVQVWAQVGAQVGDQVRVQVGVQVRDQVGAQVGDQVGAQVRDQVWAQVGAQVRDQVRDQVWAQVGDQVGDQVRVQVGRATWGQHDACWCAWVDAWRQIGARLDTDPSGLLAVARSAGWWWPFEHAVILIDRPSSVALDAQGRLHSEIGQAITYRDGWGFYAWHGLRVPEWVIRDPTPERVLSEENQEVRAAAAESLGWDNLTEHMLLVDEAPDPANPPHTLRLFDLGPRLDGLYRERVRVLVCRNASPYRDGTRRVYGLTVPAGIDSAVEAAAWTFGLSAGEYRQLEVAT